VAAVVAALELHDLVALAERAGHPQREERGFRAGGGEPDLLAARHGPAHLVGQADGGLVDQEVRRAVGELLGHGADHRGMRVAEEHRPRPEQVVDVLASAHVPQVRAAGAADHEGQFVGETLAAQHAAGQAPGGDLQQRRFGRRPVPHWISP
jgi:hypothetical protein